MQQASSGYLEDPFMNLLTSKADQTGSMPAATVESKVSHWGNHISVSFSVTLQCPQSRAHIEYAAQLAFTTATRFVNEAVSRLDGGMPMLPTG